MKYDFQAIEKKWQARWEEEKPFAAITGDPRPKFYGLIEFPYPSGQGLHVGHPRPFTAMDIICRKRRMQGYNVLFPIGFDAFGLPTENYAIKNHIHPAVVTKNNIANFTKQLKMLGYSFDWDRAVDTTDPSYYKWTQWIFLQMYKHGLAYKTTMPVNWCTSCKCVLANEEVVNGVCERCGSEVVRKEKRSSVRHIWSSRRSTRCSSSGSRTSPTGTLSPLIRKRLRTSPILSAASSTRKRPASVLRASRS